DPRLLLAGGGRAGDALLAAGGAPGAGSLAHGESLRSGGVDLERGRIALGRHALDAARDPLADPRRGGDGRAGADAAARLAGMERAPIGPVLPAVGGCAPWVDGEPGVLRA